MTEFEPLLRNAVTPYAMAVRLDAPPYLATACAALFAIPIAWWCFAKTTHSDVRLVTLVGGSLLISPYAMNYELAAFAPVVVNSHFLRPRNVMLPVIWATSLFATMSLAGLLVIYVWAVVRLFSRSSNSA